MLQWGMYWGKWPCAATLCLDRTSVSPKHKEDEKTQAGGKIFRNGSRLFVTKVSVQRDEPPQKMSKLAIAAETESDRYDTRTSIKCYVCDNDDVDRTIGNVSTNFCGA